jgi:hypothetical protein
MDKMESYWLILLALIGLFTLSVLGAPTQPTTKKPKIFWDFKNGRGLTEAPFYMITPPNHSVFFGRLLSILGYYLKNDYYNYNAHGETTIFFLINIF